LHPESSFATFKANSFVVVGLQQSCGRLGRFPRHRGACVMSIHAEEVQKFGPWFVADIGGTNARFAWVADRASGLSDVEVLAVEQFGRLDQAVRAYLDHIAQRHGASCAKPVAASLAVATPIVGDEVRFTNNPWAFSQRQLQRELGLAQLSVCNDFEALARSLPSLRQEQLLEPQAWPARDVNARATLAVVGPGTGLGVAGLVHAASGWQPIPGEGGHATLAAQTDEEWAILKAVQAEFAHVSAERLLCGSGLPLLARAWGQVHGRSLPASSAAEITDAALAGHADAVSVLNLFCGWLGSFCGSAALTFGARGGLFLGGGIAARIPAFLAASPFRARFEAKGRFQAYLRSVPTPIITDPLAALAGARTLLDQTDKSSQTTS
jgi:glucokinase